MKMSGEEIIAAPREAVWKALNDTEVLKKCIPGCESITRQSPTQMEARVVVRVGPVKTGFTGVVNLTDMDPPNGYRISGEGRGGIAGFANGGADVKLSDAPGGGTKLSYDVDAQVGGKLAMLGARLIDSTAQSLATQFFERFSVEAAELANAKPVAAKTAKKVVKKVAKKVVKKGAKKVAAKKPLAKKPAKKVVKKVATKKPPAKKSPAKKPIKKGAKKKR